VCGELLILGKSVIRHTQEPAEVLRCYGIATFHEGNSGGAGAGVPRHQAGAVPGFRARLRQDVEAGQGGAARHVRPRRLGRRFPERRTDGPSKIARG